MTFRHCTLLAVLLLPFLWCAAEGLLDPEIELLPPGAGAWIVAPLPEDGPAPPSARYRLELAAPAQVPTRVVVEITAMREFRLAVNGRPRFDSHGLAAHNWKHALRLDLGPWLELGSNEIAVEVSNDRGPTPLRVRDISANGPRLATGVAPWRAMERGSWVEAALAGQGETWLLGKGWRWHHPRRFGTLLVGVGLIIALGLLRRPKVATDGTRPGFWRRHGPVVAVLAVIVAANLWNGASFPYRRSRLDWGGHTKHLSYAASTWRPSLAHEGWQMYQPPLYYWIAARIYNLRGGDSYLAPSLRWVQILTATLGALHMVIAAFVLTRFGPRAARPRALALLALGLAPMSLTTNAMITNEPAAGLFGGLAIALALVVFARPGLGVAGGAALGLASGVALLTKFSGLMPATAIGLVLALRVVSDPSRRRSHLAAACGFAATLLASAGPYYARNYQVYGKLFVGNWDPASGFGLEQPPGYRTLDFYTRIGEVFSYAPERARWSSLWDGLYASTWGEIHDNFLSIDNYRTSGLLLIMFALALIPTAAGLRGFARSLAAAREASRHGDVQLMLVATTVFSVAAVALYMSTVPAVSTVKAFFLLHLVVPATLFTAWGLERMSQGLGRARILLDICGVALASVTLWTVLWR